MSVTARATALKAAGHDIISLGAGEPDFDTPEHIKAAAKEALDRGFTKYTAVDGIPSLKQAIVRKFARENDLIYTPSQVIVSCGAKHSIYNLLQALLDGGDEVLIPAPYWVSYPDMVLLAGAKPVIVDTDITTGFKLTAGQLDQAITPRTRLLFLNSPSNPTGVCYTRDELKELGAVLQRHPQVFIATDDIYEHILWGPEPFCNILMACPELYARTMILNGVSKAYAMTGWRIGYAAGPEKLVQAMASIQSQSTSNPTSIAQVAAEAALKGDQGCIQEMVKVFAERHQYVLERLQAIPGLRCLPAQGAFYAFPDVREAMAARAMPSDLEFAEYLIEEAEIALVPGSAFGVPGYMRLSFATGMGNLRKALDRLERTLGSGKSTTVA
jgi:aspartate aminotransferase